MAEEKENDLDWPSADVLVAYDFERDQVNYIKLSTGELLMVWDVAADREVKEARGTIIRPFWREQLEKAHNLEGEEALKFFDEAGSGWIRKEFFPETIPRWQSFLNKLRNWIHS